MYHFYDQQKYEFLVITSEHLPVGFVKISNEGTYFLDDMMTFKSFTTLLIHIADNKLYDYFEPVIALKVAKQFVQILREMEFNISLRLQNFSSIDLLKVLSTCVSLREDKQVSLGEWNAHITISLCQYFEAFMNAYSAKFKLTDTMDTFEKVANIYNMILLEKSERKLGSHELNCIAEETNMFNAPPIMDISAIMHKSVAFVSFRKIHDHNTNNGEITSSFVRLFSSLIVDTNETHMDNFCQVLSEQAANAFDMFMATTTCMEKCSKEIKEKISNKRDYVLVLANDIKSNGEITNHNRYIINMIERYTDENTLDPMHEVKLALNDTKNELYTEFIKRDFTALKRIKDNWYSEYVDNLMAMYNGIRDSTDVEFANAIVNANLLVVPCPRYAILDKAQLQGESIVVSSCSKLN